MRGPAPTPPPATRAWPAGRDGGGGGRMAPSEAPDDGRGSNGAF